MKEVTEEEKEALGFIADADLKKPEPKSSKKTISNILIAGIVVVSILLIINIMNSNPFVNAYSKQSNSLRSYILSEKDINNVVTANLGGSPEFYTVFLSLSDGENKAKVVSSTGNSIKTAYNNANDKAITYVAEENLEVQYIKADVVNLTRNVTTEELSNYFNATENFFRYGIALDPSFSTAVLEGELNANNIINYDTKTLDYDVLKNYLFKNHKKVLGTMPENFIIFSTKGYIYDNGNCETLIDELDYSYGKRELDTPLSSGFISSVIDSNMNFLKNSVKEDGSFVYGYMGNTAAELSSYNILRHAGTAWTFVNQYGYTKDKNLIPYVDSTINYLLQEVEYADDETAYLIERKSNEAKIGGNGIAIAALVNYMEFFETDEHLETAIALGNGIIAQLDLDTGVYNHVLYYGDDVTGKKDFALKDEYRTVYYDGEATYALCLLYRLTGDVKWLYAAIPAVERFIEEDYTQYSDHWVAYTMNEITKYLDNEEYLKFGLRNAMENLDTIHDTARGSFTSFELLMSTFNMYDRSVTNNIRIPYFSEFDEEKFIETINYRANHLLNSYYFPEFAMYMEDPALIMGSVFVREDDFRVRIDDVQHFIGGYLQYLQQYQNLQKYDYQVD